MRAYRFLGVLAVSALMAGCAAPGKYSWGNYDRSLYGYYKDPTSAAEHLAELESTIQYAEQTKAKIAPGIYAEYGYLLMQQGKATEAAAQFEKEKANWPESTQLMNTMISLAKKQSAKSLASKE